MLRKMRIKETPTNRSEAVLPSEAGNTSNITRIASHTDESYINMNTVTEFDNNDDEDFNNNHDDSLDLPVIENSIADRWTPQRQWSIARGWSEKEKIGPNLVSNHCFAGMVDFFQHANRNGTLKGNDARFSAGRLSVAAESSSHLTDLRSLNMQPWVYAGSGLGNVDECLSLNDDRPDDPLVHVCLAGGTSRDSLTFASACVVAACSAKDVFADDFPERIATAGVRANNSTDAKRFELEYTELLSEYVTLHKRISKIGDFLGTGWVCGEYVVDWEPVPSLIWCCTMAFCAIFTFLGTRRRRNEVDGEDYLKNEEISRESHKLTIQCDMEREKKDCHRNNNDDDPDNQSSQILTTTASSFSSSSTTIEEADGKSRWFWSAWNAKSHLKHLTQRRPETACLDGLRVGSILWVIGGHIMAIQSSTGAGYLNPKDFIPPRGFTTTFFGQLLFSSRYAVDTFLCVSGYLAAHVLQRKLKKTKGQNSQCLDILKAVSVIIFRVLRILPLYLCCLGFWMFLAPHMGSGPFWYQWENFLEPCRQTWWTNILFVNNILPLGISTEGSCFYHSWYLAVDVQLFCLFAPWLVLLYQSSPTKARNVTILLWSASTIGSALLSYTRGWSINTFDGFSVAIFDVEGYGKPHVRAQSYLAGMLVAFWPRRPNPSTRRKEGQAVVASRKHNWMMVLVLTGLAVLSFVTVTGPYTRRACSFQESPFEGDDCGSTWSPFVNFLYTAFSRAVWSVCIALLMHLCLRGEDRENSDKAIQSSNSSSVSLTEMVGDILSWSLWTPLAHLSFGAYLIHPIVIYIWFLGGREKITFRVVTYLMDFISITIVTFLASFVLTLLVEIPFGILLRPPSRRRPKPEEATKTRQDAELASLIGPSGSCNPKLYGSVQ